MPLPLTTPTALVGRCLAPRLDPAGAAALGRQLAGGAMAPEQLLLAANRHVCTPLWTARLGAHGLLPRLPGDLVEYLTQLLAANRDRNARLRRVLIEVLDLMALARIPVLLLKGAATFADGLYADPGARLMQDLDLLVPEARAAEAQALLVAEGFLADPENTTHLDPAPFKAKHAHLPGLHHPGRGVDVELHFKVAYGHSGRMLDTAAAWEAACEGALDGRPVRWLDPARRLLHQALHATQPHAEWIRGAVRLADLAEHAALGARYPEAVGACARWDLAGHRALRRDLAGYALLSRQVVLGAEDPRAGAAARFSARCARALLAGEPSRGLQARLWRLLAAAAYALRFPAWLLRNVAFGAGDTPFLRRLAYLGGKLLDRRSRAKARTYGMARG